MTTAVVTGASTGIGLATASRLAEDHEVVWACARNPDGSEGLMAAVTANRDLRPLRLDVDDDESVAAAFARIAEESPPVEVLVNNAGVSGAGAVEEIPLAEFRRQMETNYFGLLRCTQAVVGTMRERGRGTIVNISSLAGRVVRSGMGAYAGTKFAVEGMSEALAEELAPFGVRVVLIEPGAIATPIWTKASPPPSDTAYPMVRDSSMVYFTRVLAEPTPPEAVAEAVAAAVEGRDERFRIPVGWDAEQIIARRDEVADEELIAMSSRDLDHWKATWSAAFGIDLG